MEDSLLPVSTARGPPKAGKQGSDRIGLRSERRPGVSRQVGLRESQDAWGRSKDLPRFWQELLGTQRLVGTGTSICTGYARSVQSFLSAFRSLTVEQD